MWEKGAGVQTRRGGLWVYSSVCCENGVMRRFSKNALKSGAYYNVVGCISLQPYKQPSVATKNSTGDSTGVNT